MVKLMPPAIAPKIPSKASSCKINMGFRRLKMGWSSTTQRDVYNTYSIKV
jgi:hypothetical protein